MKTIDQLSAGAQFPHEACGESCTASVLYDDDKADSVPNIEKFDFGDGDNPADGTGGQVIVDRLARAGVASHIDQRPVIQVLIGARQRGLNRVFVAVWSDHGGVPVGMARSIVFGGGTPIGHWILWGGHSDYMQPVGGSIQQYDDPTIELGAQNYCVVVDQEIGMGMTQQEKQAQDLVDALLVRDMYLGRTSSLQDVQFTAARMLASDPEAGTWEITGSGEATASGGLIGMMAAMRAEINALKARLANDEAAAVTAAGTAAQASAVDQLKSEMAAIGKIASGG